MSRAIFFDLDGTLTDSGPGDHQLRPAGPGPFWHPGAGPRSAPGLVGPPLRQSFARFGVPPGVPGRGHCPFPGPVCPH